MKKLLSDLVKHALNEAGFAASTVPIQIDYTRDNKHGDFACNVALSLAKSLNLAPRDVATRLVAHLKHPLVEKIEIAGPGFINFFLTPKAWHQIIQDIFAAKENYGKSTIGHKRRIILEFVSSNPTGPLHVGHGRGAAYGAAVADLLTAIGCHVHREYYVNDAGRQMNILATSIWLRYLELCNEKIAFPTNGYQGDYVRDIAKLLHQKIQTQFKHAAKEIFADLPDDTKESEAHIDALIARTKKYLGEKNYLQVFDLGLNLILDDMRDDLKEMGLVYQQWFSERELEKSGASARAIQKLRDGGHLYEKDGALWFRATQFGDDKDRVVIRENGEPTYFANDIAYHWHKYERGFNEIIDILGADHHGYFPRIRAAMQALGLPTEDHLHVLHVQFAILYRGKERVAMSTRAGSFVTLRELREEVGKDAARFFYIQRKADQHMDFDLELAKSKSNENPVYYIQYAHARICSVFRQLKEKQLSWSPTLDLAALDNLITAEEKTLLLFLERYPSTVEQAALNFEPHVIAHYLRELAHALHTYYNTTPFLVAEEKVRQARLTLITATQQVLKNGLTLLGVSAPEAM